MTAAQRKKLEDRLIADCGAKEEVAESDVAAVMERQLPSTRAGKCMHACMIETLGLVYLIYFYRKNVFRIYEYSKKSIH